MACCLMAPNHYLNQCWQHQWSSLVFIYLMHSLTEAVLDTTHYIVLYIYIFEYTAASPRAQWVQGHFLVAAMGHMSHDIKFLGNSWDMSSSQPSLGLPSRISIFKSSYWNSSQDWVLKDKSTGATCSKESQTYDYMAGYQDSSPSNGCWLTWPIVDSTTLWSILQRKLTQV